MGDWVLLKKTSSIGEAMNIQAYLRSHGIETNLPDQHTQSLISLIILPRVLVREEDLKVASEKLAEINLKLVSDEAGGEVEDDAVEVDHAAENTVRAFRAAIFSILVHFLSFYGLYLILFKPTKKDKRFFIALAFYLAYISMSVGIIWAWLG